MIRRIAIKISTHFIEKPKPLGRWAIKSQDIKGTLANIDSCGDTLCGDPFTSSKAIDTVIQETKIKYKHDNFEKYNDIAILDRYLKSV